METQTIEQTIGQWKSVPEKAHGQPIVRARSHRNQALIESGPFRWATDLPVSLGGSNQSPSPTVLLMGALAGCAIVFIRDTLGPQLRIPIDAVTASVSCSTDARGLLGLNGVAPDLSDMCLDIEIESPAGEEGVARLLDVWRERCPVYLALVKPLNVSVTARAIDPYAAMA